MYRCAFGVKPQSRGGVLVIVPASTAVGTHKRRTVSQVLLSALRLILINFLVFAILAELVSLVIVNLNKWPSSKPTYHVNSASFWADTNPSFGVWHHPNGKFIHEAGCFSVEYDTNGYGARDKERTLHSSNPRTVVLGDSFIEGIGVP